MNVRHTLFCFFFLSLQDGNTGLINAEICTETEGGNITVECSFTFSGRKRIFCKDSCEDGDILIKTEEDRAQRGRYNIEYKEGFYPASNTLLYVSITNLTKSDSGRYQCGLFRTLFEVSTYNGFEIRVKDAPTPPQLIWTPQPTTQSAGSRSGSSSPETTDRSQPADLLLYVCLSLVLIFIILSAALLIFCRKRARKPQDPTGENEYEFMEASAEGRQSRSPAVEMSTVSPTETRLGIQALGSEKKRRIDPTVENEYEIMGAGPVTGIRKKERESRSPAVGMSTVSPAETCSRIQKKI